MRPAAPSLEETILEHPTYGRAHCSNETSEAQLDILAAVRTALTTIRQASKAITIQDWLSFPELLSRESTIRDPHEDTYTWLLHDEYHSDIERDVARRSQNRHEMCNWLKSGRGIFYISGKAGSGKSTLMKYLARSPQTREHLTHWAKTKGKDLIFAEFFFWRSGAPLEREIEGLYRGILWKILDAHPDLIQSLFPALWRDKYGAFDDKTRRTTEPMISELEAAFDILIHSPRALSEHRVCLFIDGLDEFEGDYWRLSQRLVKWCASDDMKLCVSSRPTNEFSKAFNVVPGAIRFCLHELTKPNMLHFVRDTFEKDQRYADACSDNPECASLVELIVDRADGVFLWVELVVNELLVGMGNSWSLVQLQQRLDEIPNDLRLFFGQMLGRVDRLEGVKLARSFMLLQLRRSGRLRELASTVYAHAILDDMADNPNLEIQLLDGSLGPYLSNDQCISKCSQMCRRLIGRCQGLLDIYETGWEFPDCHMIRFFHRTVADFLKEPEMQSDLQKLGRGFNPTRALAHVLLASVKWAQFYQNPIYHHDQQRSRMHNKGLSTKDYAAGVMLDLTLLSTKDFPLFNETDCFKRMMGNMDGREKSRSCRETILGRVRVKTKRSIDAADIESAALCNALSLQCSGELTKEMIRRSLTILNNPRWNALLAAFLPAIPFMDEAKISMIRVLLENGLSPNTKLAGMIHYCTVRRQGVNKIPMPTPVTTWMLTLLNVCLNWYLCESYKRNFLSYIELLLRYGADPSVYFIGYKVDSRNEGIIRSARDNDNGSDTGTGSRSSLEIKALTRGEPYYADLMTMTRLWGIQPTEQMRCKLSSSGMAQQQEIFGRSFRCLGRGEGARIQVLQPIELNFVDNTKFQVLWVLSRQVLAKISIRDLEELQEMYDSYDQEHGIRVWVR